MHKYIPRLHILPVNHSFQYDSKFSAQAFEHVNTFVFPETQFIAVTAYQNEKVSDWRNSIYLKKLSMFPIIVGNQIKNRQQSRKSLH